MTAHRSLLVLVSLLLTLAGTASGAPAALDRPSLTVGDVWTYQANSTLGGGLIVNGTMTTAVSARETDSVLGVSVPVFRLTLTGGGSASGRVDVPGFSGSVSGSWVLAGQELLETSELKVVSSVLDLSVNGTYQGFISFSFRIQNTTDFQILQDGWNYPLAPNSVGDLRTNAAYTQDIYVSGVRNRTSGSGEWTIAYSLGSLERLTVPAGTYDSYPVRETWPDGTVTVRDLSATVGNAVRIRNFNATGALLASESLLSYRYQAGEPTNLFGLTLVQWVALGAVVAAAVAVVLVLRRWRKGAPSPRGPPADPEAGRRGP